MTIYFWDEVFSLEKFLQITTVLSWSVVPLSWTAESRDSELRSPEKYLGAVKIFRIKLMSLARRWCRLPVQEEPVEGRHSASFLVLEGHFSQNLMQVMFVQGIFALCKFHYCKIHYCNFSKLRIHGSKVFFQWSQLRVLGFSSSGQGHNIPTQ